MTRTPPTARTGTVQPQDIRDSALSRFLFRSPVMAPIWLVLRLVVGWQWLTSGYEKLTDPGWVGAQAGSAIGKFLQGALDKAQGEKPDVTAWYAAVVREVALPGATFFSYVITFGELAIGLGLILGLFTGLAAAAAFLLNLNFLLAGTLSTNPLLVFLAGTLVLAWRVAGWWGLDRFALPRLWGVREQPAPDRVP